MAQEQKQAGRPTVAPDMKMPQVSLRLPRPTIQSGNAGLLLGGEPQVVPGDVAQHSPGAEPDK